MGSSVRVIASIERTTDWRGNTQTSTMFEVVPPQVIGVRILSAVLGRKADNSVGSASLEHLLTDSERTVLELRGSGLAEGAAEHIAEKLKGVLDEPSTIYNFDDKVDTQIFHQVSVEDMFKR